MMKLPHDNLQPARPGIRRRAFSLIEIMVAVALLSFIIVGLLAMFYQVQRAFRAGTAQVDVMEGGRATMSLLVRDLQEMTASNFEFVTNCLVTASIGALERYQDLPSGSRRTNFFQDISFIARVNDEWIGTSYRVSNVVNGVGVLYRFTTNRFRATLPADNEYLITDLSDEVVHRTLLGNPGFNRVVDGVVGLRVLPVFTNGIVFFNNDPALARRNPPEFTGTDSFGNRYTNANLRVVLPDFFMFRSNALPAYVDIELAILEPSTLTKFRVREESGQVQALDYLSRQAGRTHVFRQRVAIRPATTDLRSLTLN